MPDMMDRMMDTNDWDAIVVLLWVVVLAVAVAIVLLAYKVFGTGNAGAGNGRSDNGLQILDERYARGEIDLDEYQERRRAIEIGPR